MRHTDAHRHPHRFRWSTDRWLRFRSLLTVLLAAGLLILLTIAAPFGTANAAPAQFQRVWSFELTEASGQGLSFVSLSRFPTTVTIDVYNPNGTLNRTRTVSLGAYETKTVYPGQSAGSGGWDLPVTSQGSPATDTAYGMVATAAESFGVMLYPDEMLSGFGTGKTAIWAPGTTTSATWGHYNFPANACNSNAREYFFVTNPGTSTANLSFNLYKSNGTALGTNPRNFTLGAKQTRTFFLEDDLASAPGSNCSNPTANQNIGITMTSDTPVSVSVYTSLGTDWSTGSSYWQKHDESAGVYPAYDNTCLRENYAWSDNKNGGQQTAARVTNPNNYPITINQKWYTVDGSPTYYERNTTIPAFGTAELPAPAAYDPGWKDEAVNGKYRLFRVLSSIDDPNNANDQIGSYHVHVTYDQQIDWPAVFNTDWFWGSRQPAATDELFLINPYDTSLTINVEYADNGTTFGPGQAGGTPIVIPARTALEWQIPSDFLAPMTAPSLPGAASQDVTLHYFSDTAFPLHLELTYPGPYGDLQTYDCGFGAGFDFGDAPDTGIGTGPGNYETTEQDDGPHHTATPLLYMGAEVDVEGNGQPTVGADGDDLANDPDDEDGVDVTDLTLTIGGTASVDVTAFNNSGLNAYLVGWIDFDGDGVFEASERQTLTIPSNASPQNVTLNFGTVTGSAGTTYARFRLGLDQAKAELPTGWAGMGEIEDYPVTIQAPAVYDFGDLPDTGAGTGTGNYQTLLANGGPRHTIAGPRLGAAVDNETNGQPNATATGDDIAGATPDDEDGVTIPSLVAGQTATVVVNSSAAGKLNAFFDWNNDGDFADAGEVIAELSVVAGSNNLSVPVPANAIADTPVGARFRLSTAGGLGPTGNAPDGEVEDYLATVARTGSIGNYVWVDENSDGYQDAGEPGLPNVAVKLYDEAGNVVATTYTDAQGGYLFDNLPPGNYFVDVVEATLPVGMTQTPYNLPGADFGNQDQSTGVGDYGYPVTLPSGGENLTADFGYNYNPTTCVDDPSNASCNDDTAALGDRVWIDADGDGAQDPDEVGLPGVCVELFTAGPDGIFGTPDDVSLGTQTTDANGNYLFDGLATGAYVVRMCASNFQPGGPLDGYSQTGDPDHFGQPGGVNDNATTNPVILAPGDVFLNADFGYQPPVCGQIGDTIWFDADADGSGPALAPVIGGAPVNQGNGLQNDSSEIGIPGVTVALIRDLNANGIWDAAEPIIGTTVTNATGQYLFPCLDTTNGQGSDDYLIWINDTDNVLGDKTPTYDKDGGADSGSGAPTGVASSTVLGLGSVLNLDTTPVMDQDFGYTVPGQTNVLGLIGDRVWLDIDNDGVQDPDEPGLEGIQVELYDSDNNLIGVTTTDENGNYYFGGLPAGTYTVQVSPPPGLNQTYDADGLGTPHQSTVTIAAGEVNLLQDFGYQGTGTVGNLVWEDLDADGFADLDEPGIGGVTIDLYWDQNGNGTIDPGEPLVGSTVTAPDGSYLFSGLPVNDGGDNAQFVVDVTNENGVLGGYWHSLGTPGQDNNSQTDPYAVTLTPTTPNDLTADFGYFVKPGCLGNFVWLDGDGNGIQNSGEPGIDDVEITLTAKYAGASSTGFTVRSGDDPGTGTVEKGWYGFCNLLLDEDHASSKTGSPTPTQPVYTISVQTPAGYNPTTVNASGSTPMDDSDNHTGVDGLATQGQTDVTQKADPNAESNPIAGYDFGYTTDLDFGDLADTPYPTLLANNGARHAIVSGVALGGAPDAETNGQPNAAATGDDLANLDDEDGVVFLTPLAPSTTANIQVTITDGDGSACLSAFIDFDGNGTLDPVSYTAIDGAPGAGTVGDLVLSNGVHTLTISVPSTTTGTTPARFRLTDTCGEGGNSPVGLATSGEVEDYALGSIGDFVWDDQNGNGQQDGGEPGVGGVTVNLLDGNGNPVLDADGNPITTVSDANGNYEFPGLPPGTYIVEFVPPPNTAITTPDQGNDATDSDANQVTGQSGPVTLTPGDSNDTVDAGLIQPAGQGAIGNLVFCDYNGNGITDAGDYGQSGVTVRLYGLGQDNSPYTADDVLVSTTTTDANGNYLFAPVTPGQYYVAVDVTTVPPSCGVRSSQGGGGDPDQEDHDLPGGDDGIPNEKPGEVVTGVLSVTVNGQTTPDTGDPLGYPDASSYMTVDFGFTNDPNAVGLRTLQARSTSLVDLLIDWLRQVIRW